MKEWQNKMKKVVTMGELLLRLSPPGKGRFISANCFEANYGGAELNVAVNLANLGLDVSAITKVPENEIGSAALRHLKSYGVDTSHIARGGERLGIYFLENGYSIRSSKVVYDRKYSSITAVSIDEFDIDAIFKDADLFHVSGITLALSQDAFKLSEYFMQEAQKRGITVSFDFNFRSKLWTLEECKAGIEKILKYVDIALCGYLDFTNILGFTSDKETLIEKYQDLYPQVAEKYGFKYIVSSMRDVLSASKNNYKGLIFNGQEMLISKEYSIDIIDRVGSGDAFTSGFLYAFLNSDSDDYRIEFAAASAALKHTIEGDSNPVSKSEVEALFAGKGFDVGR